MLALWKLRSKLANAAAPVCGAASILSLAGGDCMGGGTPPYSIAGGGPCPIC